MGGVGGRGMEEGMGGVGGLGGVGVAGGLRQGVVGWGGVICWQITKHVSLLTSLSRESSPPPIMQFDVDYYVHVCWRCVLLAWL